MSVNKVILVGNVGKDPDVRYLEKGVAIARFPLATSETYKSRDGERVTATEWHNIVLWRGLAEIAEKYVKKGSQLYIEGKVRTRSYDDKDGNKKYMTEIVADQMQMLGKKSDSQNDDTEDRQSGAASSSSREEQPDGASNRKGSDSGYNSDVSSSGEISDDTFDTAGASGDDDLPF
ncbi:MAG: single-stranded DNA-binding protein [Bacteroidales bacterium]